MPDVKIDSKLAQQISQTIAEEIGAQASQARAAIALLDEGASVPFIARYRKEVTGGLDDTQLRNLEVRLTYLRELEERRAAVLASIDEQGKLSDELRAEIIAADTKSRLEDLYLPYKPKRRTRAQIAREAGLEPLADGLLADPAQVPETLAAGFVDADKGVVDVKAALEGARAILMERWGEDAALVGELRQWLGEHGVIRARVAEGKEEAGAKYRDYFEHAESLARIPSHRLLALFRARREEILFLDLDPGSDAEAGHQYCEGRVALAAGVANQNRAADAWLLAACRLTWRAKLHMHLLLDLFNQAREKAEAEAIAVFGDNLKDLLLAAPAGQRTVLGLDPGIRTGCKIAVVDATGKLVATETIYPHEPKRQWDQSLAVAAQAVHATQRRADRHWQWHRQPRDRQARRRGDQGDAGQQAAEGGGQRGRRFGVFGLGIRRQGIPGAGRVAAWRGVDRAAPAGPAGGVGEDRAKGDRRGPVPARRRPVPAGARAGCEGRGLRQRGRRVRQHRLGGAAVACVRPVFDGGREHRAPSRRQRPVQAPQGPAESAAPGRQDLRAMRRLSCALPTVMSRWTPRRCTRRPTRWSNASSRAPASRSRRCWARGAFLRGLRAEQYTDEKFGVPTVRDILKELEKPGRDPRPEFKAARFAEGVEELKDLRPGMVLEGVVSNVAAFGAFVDIGVHQDGLIHISALSDTYVKDPRDVVKAGDIVKVKVLEVDVARKRIALTRRLEEVPTPAARDARAPQGNPREGGRGPGRSPGPGAGKPRPAANNAPPANSALADAFARARKG